MPNLQDLPIEFFLDDLFPVLPLKDLLSLSCTNKFFAILGSDNPFWHRKVVQDFNFSRTDTARTKGFKFLYSRLRRPKVFVWGGDGEGRLGVDREARNIQNSPTLAGTQFWPLELNVSQTSSIVQLVAGGWSFSALDSEGGMYVWGQLENGWSLTLDGFSNPCKQASTPHRLELPFKVNSLHCGRNFSVALDQNHQIRCFNNWGRPFHFKHAAFDATDVDNTVIQIDAGWTFSVALTGKGTVYAWSPGHGEMQELYMQKMGELDAKHDTKGIASKGIIKCHSWEMTEVKPLQLPGLPMLPKLHHTQSESDEELLPVLVKIAAGDQFVIGLTNQGHVLYFDLEGINEPQATADLERLFARQERQWKYLPKFSDIRSLESHEAYNGAHAIPRPERIEITHISAHFKTFVSYSTGTSSAVFIGKSDGPETPPNQNPQIIPALQNQGVISVILGDYHYGALLESGKLLTWGSAIGAGLGNPLELEPGAPGGLKTLQERERARTRYSRIPDVQAPTEVKFDWGYEKPREHFVFGAAAAGWHTGALVIDMDDSSEEKVIRAVDPPAPESSEGKPAWPPVSGPGFASWFPFRVGLAGGSGAGGTST